MSTKIFTSKAELAQRYLPDLTPRSAVNRLMAWVRLNTTLHAKLIASGYKPTNKQLTRQQVQLIYEYLGEP